MYGVTPSTPTEEPSTDGVTVGVGITVSARASLADPRPPSSRAPTNPATRALPPAMTRRRLNPPQVPVLRSSLGRGRSRTRVSIPTAVPMRVGSTSGAEASGREMTAAMPRTPTTPRRTAASRMRLRARTPMSPQATSNTTVMPTDRASLSLVPNAETAKSLSHGGVRSMNAPATAGIGDGVPPAIPSQARTPASRVATPIETAPARTPSRAAPHADRTGEALGASSVSAVRGRASVIRSGAF
jgi:hypothetical protein